jgi:hypothetical protein
MKISIERRQLGNLQTHIPRKMYADNLPAIFLNLFTIRVETYLLFGILLIFQKRSLGVGLTRQPVRSQLAAVASQLHIAKSRLLVR